VVHRVVSTVAGSGGVGAGHRVGFSVVAPVQTGRRPVQLAIWAACAADSGPYAAQFGKWGTERESNALDSGELTVSG
jgi:hypothetical protein